MTDLAALVPPASTSSTTTTTTTTTTTPSTSKLADQSLIPSSSSTATITIPSLAAPAPPQTLLAQAQATASTSHPLPPLPPSHASGKSQAPVTTTAFPVHAPYLDPGANSSTDSLPTSGNAGSIRRSAIANNRNSPPPHNNSSSRINLSGLAALARDKTSHTFANLTAKPWNHHNQHQHPAHDSTSDPGSDGKIADQRAPPIGNSAVATSTTPGKATAAPHGVQSQLVEHRPTREIPRSHPGPAPAPQHARDSRPHTPASHSRASSAVTSRSSSPVPQSSPGSYNKMHQTSSRLLRMTEEERPFTRDFKDLFSTLIVSLPLIAHRVRFQKVEHTFTSEEAINNLGSLKFSQSNRMPDPKDPSRIVTTTTTTTFSMAREMARSVCQRFMDGRFIESADGKHATTFPLKNGVWQLTPKGMHVLSRFCQRNGITQKHVLDLLESPRNIMQLVLLEREVATDRLSHDKATTEVIFRRFVGQHGPNTKQSTATADSDSLSDYYNGMIGVKMAKERKIFEKTVRNTFTGKAAVDWLMDCSTTVDRKEACETAAQFVLDGLMYPIMDDKSYITQHPTETSFQPTKGAVYALTNKGQRVAGWIIREKSSSSDEEGARQKDHKIPSRDSNNNRLGAILGDPALRLLFREFLRDTHCEENLAFYLDVVEFTSSYRNGVRKSTAPKIDTIRETLAAAYGLYNAFLAPGSPCELNIDHNLRNNLASRMTRAVGDDQAMVDSLNEVARLFEEAQTSVFKLMSSVGIPHSPCVDDALTPQKDSVPKFLKDSKYAEVLREHDFDAAVNNAAQVPAPTPVPGRTASKLGR
ncbi:MAG: hypothetical protein M1832_006471 [Thelocarpon impressellum]|nr:MAG: hypothetical protein M1832_006471 [Thelocarpon impressellum]